MKIIQRPQCECTPAINTPGATEAEVGITTTKVKTQCKSQFSTPNSPKTFAWVRSGEETLETQSLTVSTNAPHCTLSGWVGQAYTISASSAEK